MPLFTSLLLLSVLYTSSFFLSNEMILKKGLVLFSLCLFLVLFCLFCFVFKIYLFIFGCMGLVAMHRLCLVPETAGHFPVAESARASHCGGFSCCGTWALGLQYLQCVGSVVVVHRLSCPATCGILLPQPGI